MKPTTPTPDDINRTLREIERTELPEEHPRQFAAGAVKRYRRGTAIRLSYNFSEAPRELRQTVYNQIVRYHCSHSWWSKLFRR